MYIPEDPQKEFADLPFSESLYRKDHPLLKLEAAIRWDHLLEALRPFYSEGKGRPTIPLRAQVGTLILKFVKDLPDRDTVRFVEENLYAQRFCGLHPAQAGGYMNPKNGLTNFRGKIGREGMAVLEAVLQAAARKKLLMRGDQLIIDPTCVPLDVHYPTDIRLLERCRREMIGFLKGARDFGLKVFYRTYNRTARKGFVQFSKLSKPKEKTRRRVHKKMIQFVRRNLKQLVDLRQRATRELGPKARMDPEVHGFLKGLKEAEEKIRLILHQQKQVYRGVRSIPGRIVSFHKDHVRPIVRGKFPLSTEFGPKVVVAVARGLTHVIETFQTNVSDATLVVPALKWFKTMFGRLPREVLGDRGLYSRMRVGWLKLLGIRSGLQPRGHAVEVSATMRRQIRQRLLIEARISLAKRKFGWGRCRARIDDHESSWIRLGAAAMNAHLAYLRSPP